MDKVITKQCMRHGCTEYVLGSNGVYRCKKCRVEDVQKRRDKVRQMLVEEFGGECKLCGYNKCCDALHFHHIDSSTKCFGLDKSITRAYKDALAEARKCVLLCANCHAEVEAGLVQPLPCGVKGSTSDC